GCMTEWHKWDGDGKDCPFTRGQLDNIETRHRSGGTMRSMMNEWCWNWDNNHEDGYDVVAYRFIGDASDASVVTMELKERLKEAIDRANQWRDLAESQREKKEVYKAKLVEAVVLIEKMRGRLPSTAWSGT